MEPIQLEIFGAPRLERPRLVMGLSGWMDGGDVSTGTVETFIDQLESEPVARIHPQDFYLYSFPGTMEISALFRPFCDIRDGRVEQFDPPGNRFYAHEGGKVLLFVGKEPHLQWEQYADCVFTLADRFDVEEIYFIGSVAGVVPHTREPRLFATCSDEALREELAATGVRFSSYKGPASISTYMLSEAPHRGVRMAALVAEIPAYIHGRNPRCIEAMTRRLAAMFDVPVELEAMRALSDTFERKVNEVVGKREELTELIEKLESDYDSEVFDTQMGDLKDWLHQQGIRLD